MRQWLPLIVLTGIMTTLSPSPGWAGGFEFPAQGALSLSRGGAFAARADDPSAMVHNPAGIARLQGTHIWLSGNVIMEDMRFQRLIYDETTKRWSDRYPDDPNTRMPEISNSDGAFITPLLGVTTDLGVLRPYRLVLMAGVFGPHVHPSRTYPRFCKRGVSPCEPVEASVSALPSPARYDVGHVDVLVIYPTLGLAWQPIKGLSIGGVFQFTWASLTFNTVISGAGAIGAAPTTTKDRENPMLDVDVKVTSTDPFTPTGVLGAHWAPLPFLEIGASVRIGFELQFEGEADTSSTGLLDVKTLVQPNPSPINVAFHMPWVVRGGVRYVNRDAAQRERFDVELDFTWESTSQVDALDVVMDAEIMLDPKNPIKVSQLDQTHGWQDQWSLRLGGSYQLHDLIPQGLLRLSLGGMYESSGVPENYARLDYLPFERYGFGLGVSASWRWLQLSVGYAHYFHTSRTETDSQIKQMNPIEASYGGAIGNGNWAYDIDVVTVGLAAQFGG